MTENFRTTNVALRSLKRLYLRKYAKNVFKLGFATALVTSNLKK